jgi:hypothetical protein
MGLGPLYAVLGGLARHVARSGGSLRDVFMGGAGAPSAPAREAILGAYRSMATRPRQWVRLAKLRDHLGAYPRQVVDAALHELYDEQRINLSTEDNSKAVTADDQRAALRLGTDQVHLLLVR